ncbi:MAG TPA: hypothetical protein VH877_14165 [Polyangia bacterium]|nr:hypothetical protein [Polyangia bacterium]
MTRTIGRLIQTGLLAASLTWSASALAQSGAGVTGQGTMPTQPGSKAGGPWNPDRQATQDSSSFGTEPRGTLVGPRTGDTGHQGAQGSQGTQGNLGAQGNQGTPGNLGGTEQRGTTGTGQDTLGGNTGSQQGTAGSTLGGSQDRGNVQGSQGQGNMQGSQGQGNVQGRSDTGSRFGAQGSVRHHRHSIKRQGRHKKAHRNVQGGGNLGTSGTGNDTGNNR